MKESLGSKIKRLRIERNMTQDELAKILGYSSRSTINKIESDINTLSYDKLLKLVDVFKSDINELIKSAFEVRIDNNINEGDNMYINEAEEISGIPSSWPGYNLEVGASGAKVQQMQQQLNAIAEVYTAIPQITADGIYGERTADAVRAFQRTFGLPQTGIVDYSTWYRISQIYVGVTRIAELQ